MRDNEEKTWNCEGWAWDRELWKVRNFFSSFFTWESLPSRILSCQVAPSCWMLRKKIASMLMIRAMEFLYTLRHQKIIEWRIRNGMCKATLQEQSEEKEEMEQVMLHCFNELRNLGFCQGFLFPRSWTEAGFIILRGFLGDRESNTK